MNLYALNIALAATLAAAVALAAERLCRRNAAALRHALLYCGMAVVIAVPLLTRIASMTGTGLLRGWSIPAPINTDPSSPRTDVDAQSAAPASGTPVAKMSPTAGKAVAQPLYRSDILRPAAVAFIGAADILIAVWAAGTTYCLFRLLRSWAWLRRLPSFAMPVSSDVHRLASAATRRLRLRRMPEVSWCAAAPSPLVMGLLRPRVLLPRSAAALSADELQAVLLHELAHVARGDQWAGMVAALVRAAFWWCPPVRMLLRRLGDLREQLCDAQVVACQGHGLNLASALLVVCEGSMRGRRACAAAALGAAGSSGHALRIRIQSLTDEEDIPMIHTTLRMRLAVGAVGFLIAGAATLLNVRMTDASPAILTGGALSSAPRLLAAADFWQKTGATSKHDFDNDTVAELRKLAESSERPEIRIRATKLVCDQDNHSRFSAKLTEAESAKVVAAAFEYLEAHLADPEVAKYAPDRGFTHMTVSEYAGDKDHMWVLIETAGGRDHFNGGLNIQVELKTSTVTSVKHWGAVRDVVVPAK